MKAYEEPIMPMTTNLTASKICLNKFFWVHHLLICKRLLIFTSKWTNER